MYDNRVCSIIKWLPYFWNDKRLKKWVIISKSRPRALLTIFYTLSASIKENQIQFGNKNVSSINFPCWVWSFLNWTEKRYWFTIFIPFSSVFICQTLPLFSYHHRSMMKHDKRLISSWWKFLKLNNWILDRDIKNYKRIGITT